MSALADLLRGLGAHVDPRACVDDLSWELAGRRVIHHPHTIWQLLGHLIYWMDHELRCIEGPEVPLPAHADESWPKADGPADEVAWQHEVALLRTSLDQLATLANAQASTLARIVHPRKGVTVETVLWMLVAHNSYHTGQIVTLRHAMGAWPPPGGGGTW